MLLNPQNPINALALKIEELEARIRQLEQSQIDPHNIVSFTTVAVSGQLNLKPLAINPTCFQEPSGQVTKASNPDYQANLSVLEYVAVRHKLLKRI